MKYFNKCIIAGLLIVSLLGNPKALGWWNLIFPVEYTNEEEKAPDIKFFFVEWLKSIRSCKK